MQSKKLKSRESEPLAAADGSPPVHAPAYDATTRFSFRLAVATVVLWWMVLTTLVLLTSNPVTLNTVQVKLADAVVTAKYTDPANGVLTVENVWTGRFNGDTLQLDPSLIDGAATDSEWLIPLTHRGKNGYEVTRAVITDARGDKVVQPAYVYPWNDETREQLKTLLK